MRQDDDAGFRFPGAGLASRRHGARARRGLCNRTSRLRGDRRRAEPAPVAADVRGTGERAHPDRERPACAHGGEPRRAARPGKGRRLRPAAQRPLCRRPFARRVFGSGRGALLRARRCGAAAEAPRPVDAARRAGRRGGHGGSARARSRAGSRRRRGGAAGTGERRQDRGVQRRQRQRAGPGRGERRQGGGRPRHSSSPPSAAPSARSCCRSARPSTAR